MFQGFGGGGLSISGFLEFGEKIAVVGSASAVLFREKRLRIGSDENHAPGGGEIGGDFFRLASMIRMSQKRGRRGSGQGIRCHDADASAGFPGKSGKTFPGDFIGGLPDHSVVGFVAAGKSCAARGGIGDGAVRRGGPDQSADRKLVEREFSRRSVGIQGGQGQSALPHAVSNEKNDVAGCACPGSLRKFRRIHRRRSRICPLDLPCRIRRVEREMHCKKKHCCAGSSQNHGCSCHSVVLLSFNEIDLIKEYKSGLFFFNEDLIGFS